METVLRLVQLPLILVWFLTGASLIGYGVGDMTVTLTKRHTNRTDRILVAVGVVMVLAFFSLMGWSMSSEAA